MAFRSVSDVGKGDFVLIGGVLKEIDHIDFEYTTDSPSRNPRGYVFGRTKNWYVHTTDGQMHDMWQVKRYLKKGDRLPDGSLAVMPSDSSV